MTSTLHVGDCRAILATLPAESVQCVVTSPPYYGLRDYGTATWEGGDPACDHLAPLGGGFNASGLGNYDNGLTYKAIKDKVTSRRQQYRDACARCGARRIDQQIGLESSPQAYVDELVAVFSEVRRVLRRDGTLWLNLGDSYAGMNGGYSGDNRPSNVGGKQRTNHGARASGQTRKMGAGLKPKDLLLIPARVALALQADGWWLRSEIIWSKAAPMPESVRDRPTCAHEKVFLLTKAANYYYDADAVREEYASNSINRKDYFDSIRGNWKNHNADRNDGGAPIGASNPLGRNLRNVWHLNPEPSGVSTHFATMPATLAERCIKAGTSEKGQCPHCGAPWVRVVERTLAEALYSTPYSEGAGRNEGGRSMMLGASAHTLGWSPSCTCPEHVPVPQTVLDPFAGAGTTLLVADRLQRHGIGIELNVAYAALARQRLFNDAPLFAEVA